MPGINIGRVILGGLVAGLIINVGESIGYMFVMGEAMDQALAARNLSMPADAGTMAAWIAYGFVYGIFTIFLYAAIRPRFGAGPKTALYAGLMVWFIGGLMWSASMATMGIFPTGLLAMGTLWSLVEICIAAVGGAALYQEGEAVAAAASTPLE